MPARVVTLYEGAFRAARTAIASPRVALIFALLLALAPGLAAADARHGAGATTGLRPPTRDYAALMRAPASRTAHYPIGPTAQFGPATPGTACRAALAAAEARHAIPSGLLQAIGLVESGRPDATTGARAPWPWTINVEGESRYFDTKAQAVTWVRQAQAHGTRSIDTGCAQVNLMHHPAAFASLEQAFDPAANADYAARFLCELRAMTGNWMTAVGFYHSQTPDLAEAYRRQVTAAGTRTGGAGATQYALTPYAMNLAFIADRYPPIGSAGRSVAGR